MAKRFFQLKKFDTIHVPDIVVKIRPYLYCTKREKDGGVFHPNADVKIVADIWIVIGTGKKGFGNTNISTDYVPRCTIDAEAGTITRNSSGEEIRVSNFDDVIRIVKKRVFIAEEETVHVN